jgi:hypothetical protein
MECTAKITKRQQKFWNRVCRKFQEAKDNQTEVCVHRGDDVWITVSGFEVVKGGCGRCKQTYPHLELCGYFRAAYEEHRLYMYTATTSFYCIHTCVDDKFINTKRNITLKFYVMGTVNCCPQYVLCPDFVKKTRSE